MRFAGITFGVPKEIMQGERRIAAIPETVKKMVLNGAKVLIEKGAGEGSFFSDEKFIQAGAEIVDNAKDVYGRATVILKVKEPRYNIELGVHEADMLKKGQLLIAFLHPASPQNHELIRNIAKTGATSVTLDGIPRMTRTACMDPLISMSTVAGYKSVISAADRLTKFLPMLGTAVGMIKPSHVVVIGTGVAGLQAVATAKRLGSVVSCTDVRADACEQAKSLGARILDLEIPASAALGEGGNAKRLSDEWLTLERKKITDLVKTADILILSALIPGKKAPVLVTEDMVKLMGPGSIIVDISVDQGGNCALTEPEKICVKHGIIIDGTRNIPATMPASSTFMFSHNIYNLVEYLAAEGRINADKNDPIVKSILTTHNGEIVHAGAKEAMAHSGE